MAEYNNLPHMGYDYEKPDEYIDPMKPIIEEIMGEFRIQQEDNVMKAVADVGIYVDKPRLMQALTDAKAFYEEGYRAAMQRADAVEVRHGEWLPDYEIFVNEPFDTYVDRVQTGWKCSLCGRVECEKEPYCNCGAKMDGKGEGE